MSKIQQFLFKFVQPQKISKVYIQSKQHRKKKFKEKKEKNMKTLVYSSLLATASAATAVPAATPLALDLTLISNQCEKSCANSECEVDFGKNSMDSCVHAIQNPMQSVFPDLGVRRKKNKMKKTFLDFFVSFSFLIQGRQHGQLRQRHLPNL